MDEISKKRALAIREGDSQVVMGPKFWISPYSYLMVPTVHVHGDNIGMCIARVLL